MLKQLNPYHNLIQGKIKLQPTNVREIIIFRTEEKITEKLPLLSLKQELHQDAKLFIFHIAHPDKTCFRLRKPYLIYKVQQVHK